MSAATIETDAVSANRWRANRPAALLARIGVFAIPLMVGSVVMWLVSSWGALALVAGIGAAAATDRISRRLGPVSTLFELDLTFPEKAPSRVAMSQRILKTTLEDELADISTGEDFEPDDPQVAAERSLVLVGLLDQHDRLTRGHSARVSRYVDQTALAMGLSEVERSTLSWAALLHDIGKLRVSSEILTRDSKPNEADLAIIQGHPGHSADLMRSLFDWLGDSFGAATEHHEKWDGSGYPLQLAREEISLAGRITAVADAFDVMTASNSYRSSLSVADAKSELMACSGSHFDPAVVRAFINLSMARRWVRPLAWIVELPGLATNALGAAPIAIAAIVLGLWTAVGAVSSGANLQPDELAAVDEDIIKDPSVPAPSTETAPVDSPDLGTTATTNSEADPAPSQAPPTTEASNVTESTNETTATPETQAPTTSPAGTAAVNYPAASDDSYSTGAGAWVVMDVLINDDSGDFAWDQTTLDFYIEPEQGAEWEALADGRLRYRPQPTYAGPDTFKYVVCNTGGHCAIGTVLIAVQEN